MNIRRIILSDAAYPLYGYAKNKLFELERKREEIDVELLKRILYVNEIFIELYAGRQEHRIIMWGGDAGMNMAFSSYGSGTTITPYSYLTDKLGKAVAFDAVATCDIHPFANGEVHVCDSAAASFANTGRAVDLISPNSGDWIATDFSAEVELLHEENVAVLRTEAGAGTVATGTNLLPQLSGFNQSLFGIASYPQQKIWNNYKGADLFYVNPLTATTGEIWKWIPSFFVAAPADTNGLEPGWYYGAYPVSHYKQTTNLTSLSVSLCGILETYYPQSAQYVAGWCEMVTEVDGVSVGDINFYLSSSFPSIPNNTNYREFTASSYNTAKITIGSALDGFERAFSVKSITDGVKPNQVKMWNVANYTGVEAIAAIIVENHTARCIKYAGYANEFFRTDKFHSYAIGTDGTQLAVFEYTDNPAIIAKVTVFDLRGERIELLKEPAAYSAGGVTTVRVSEVPAGLNAQSGCFIPFRPTGFLPEAKTFDIKDIPVSTYGDTTRLEMPALATLEFIKNASAPLTIQKVECSNGVDATFRIVTDGCFDSTIVVDLPDGNGDKLVSTWNENTTYRGQVRGDFVGDKFEGEGSGSSPWYGVITRPDTFSINIDEKQNILYGSYLGELISQTCVDANGKFDGKNCPFDCATGEYTLTAASTCGQTASGKIIVAVTPLSISGDGDCNVGDFYTASGGIAPYSYSFGGGSIDSDTGEILAITVCSSGAARYADVTATDSCGNTASLEVRLPGGTWAEIWSVSGTGGTIYPVGISDCVCGDGYACTGEKITGGQKYVEDVQWGSFVGDLGAPITVPVSGFCAGLTTFATIYCKPTTAGTCADAFIQYPSAKRRTLYEWRCPVV